VVRILLTNDDGYQAPGIRALYEVLSEVADVTVVAPDRERSAVSLGITIIDPLRAWPLKHTGMKGFCVNGTPADCVKLAMHELLDHKPDIVFSGINQGTNVGLNSNYSGTVAGAVEGAMNGVPAVAMSLLSFTSRDYEGSAKVAKWLVKRLNGGHKLPSYHVLNVNIPALPLAELRGIKVAPLSHVLYREVVEKRYDTRNHEYYWLGGRWTELADVKGGDHEVTTDGYVAVAPLLVDWTAHNLVESLRKDGWDEEWTRGEQG